MASVVCLQPELFTGHRTKHSIPIVCIVLISHQHIVTTDRLGPARRGYVISIDASSRRWSLVHVFAIRDGDVDRQHEWKVVYDRTVASLSADRCQDYRTVALSLAGSISVVSVNRIVRWVASPSFETDPSVAAIETVALIVCPSCIL